MKKFTALKNFVFTLCALFCALITQAQWRVSTPYNGAINDIFFTDRLTGFVCGQAAGIGNCSGTTSIQRTIDGGETWIRMNTGSTSALTRLHFVDSYTGWAVGASSAVLKTIDGGQSWTIPSSGVGAGLNDIHFPTANVGFVVGLNGLIRKSSNGGASWTTIASGVTTTLNSVWFADANNGYFVGNSGVIRKTTNGGTSWNSVYSGSEFFREVWFADANNGYVLSNNKILKTTDGGNNWTTYNAPVGQNWLRMNFSSILSGVIVTDGDFILKTNNGGETWNSFPTDFNETMGCAFFLDENNGFFGSYSLGRITKTTDGCNSWKNMNSGMGERIQGIDFRTPQKGVFVSNSGGIFTTTNGALNVRKMHSNNSRFLSAVNWMNDSTIIACGDSGIVLRSTNSGWSWNEINTGTSETLLDMFAIDSVRAYISGNNGAVIKTVDAGLTWTSVSIDTILPLRGIHFLNKDTGMTCGDYAVFRTNNGGATWELKNDSIQSTSDFNDVWMTSNSIAYAAGGFGRMYKTRDGGEIWRRVFPADNTNAEIEEMQFFTDSIGYFARLGSQSITTNGGTNVGSMSTYCLANNGGINTIEMYSQEYGYCAGGLSSVLHTLKPFELLRTYLQDSIFCSGSRIFVGYNAAGLLYNNNVITAQLSDASGSFTNPVSIGSYAVQAPETDPSGIITCTLPSGLNGNNYRIRVVCASPDLTSPDNGFDIQIRSSIQPVISIDATPDVVCSGQSLMLNASGIGLGMNPQYAWTINGTAQSFESPSISIDTVNAITNASVQITSSLTCASPNTNTTSTQVNIASTATVYAGNDEVICEGESIQLGSQFNENVIWYPSNGLSDASANEPFANPNSSTTYYVISNLSSYCIGKDSVFVLVNSIPTQPVIVLNGGQLSTSLQSGNYTWYLNDVILDGENSNSITINALGNYQVQFSDTNGCVSPISSVFTIGSVGIFQEHVSTSMHMENQTLMIQSPIGITNYSIFDISGRLVMSGKLNLSSQITLNGINAGIYVIRFSGDVILKSEKFVLN